MPLSAMAATTPDRVLPVAAMGKVLVELVGGSRGERRVTRMQREGPSEAAHADRREGELTGLRCPECGGPLWEVRAGALPRYRCRVGHAYSEDTFLSEQGATVESALWTALEVLEEREQLLRKVAGRVAEGTPGASARLRDGADRAHEQADLLRQALGAPATADSPAAEATAA
jgi:two-component system chemotaxis response regulator CheB